MTAQSSGAAAASCRLAVRVAAVSYVPPFHDHQAAGVDLQALRQVATEVARYRPDFICFPEGCTCVAEGLERGIRCAPELEPYVAEVGRIARDAAAAVIAPFLERRPEGIYNSVPVVDRRGDLVLVYRKNYPTSLELELGILPGEGIPVAECDGVRVGRQHQPPAASGGQAAPR